ncbi:MAG: hypothetical protein IJV14_09590, partial [Lachnospiraceae bacterium]|nr:hypothetical protein [Lachnospiraceae bacterium]
MTHFLTTTFMTANPYHSIKYSIMDPTGNVTALVESPVGLSMQPDVADRIMKKHPEVEQAGFLIFEPD